MGVYAHSRKLYKGSGVGQVLVKTRDGVEGFSEYIFVPFLFAELYA